MTKLILFGLILVYAKLWFEVTALKARVDVLDGSPAFEPTAWTAQPAREVEPAIGAALPANDAP